MAIDPPAQINLTLAPRHRFTKAPGREFLPRGARGTGFENSSWRTGRRSERKQEPRALLSKGRRNRSDANPTGGYRCPGSPIDRSDDGSDLADRVSSKFWKDFAYPSIFFEDPRYYPLGQGTTKKRLLHAAEHLVVAHHSDGSHMFNYSEWPGTTTAVLRAIYIIRATSLRCAIEHGPVLRRSASGEQSSCLFQRFGTGVLSLRSTESF